MFIILWFLQKFTRESHTLNPFTIFRFMPHTLIPVSPSLTGMFISRDRTIRKRKREERIFAFHNFGDPGFPADYNGPFRDNVRVFLDECAESEVNIDGLPAWCIALEDDSTQGTRLNLLVIVEGVHNSLHPHCDKCRCIGKQNSNLHRKFSSATLSSCTYWELGGKHLQILPL